jgi:23S rRNA pseudouridine1911/1915/1917 synthase
LTTPAADRPADDFIELDIVVPPECGGWRLDHFLKRRIGRLSRTRIQAIIGEQIFFSDGRTARPAASVRAGETIRLRRPAPVEPPVPRRFEILYQDDSVLVIDKPAGLPMHTTAKFWRNTLTALLRERYPDEQMEVAHRIDRETSGVLLIARGRPVASFLTRAFARRAVDKTYLALVKGNPPDEGRIDRPLKLLDTRSRVMMGVARDGDGAGLPAVTTFRVVRRFAAHALCAAHPETGRQHQIRVHFQSLGHPIVGDKLYGAGEELFMRACDQELMSLTPELLQAFDGLPRHALHAHRLTFPHPTRGEPVTVESPLPADLTDYMDRLQP